MSDAVIRFLERRIADPSDQAARTALERELERGGGRRLALGLLANAFAALRDKMLGPLAEVLERDANALLLEARLPRVGPLWGLDILQQAIGGSSGRGWLAARPLVFLHPQRNELVVDVWHRDSRVDPYWGSFASC